MKNCNGKKPVNFHNSHKFICIDCGCEMDKPPFRINTNDGWKWLCRDCKNKGVN